MKLSKIIAGLVASLAVAWGGYRLYAAYFDLVTLNVRNADLGQVVRKMEWQTWESILLNTNVGGSVTLNVKRVPLPEVLNIIALQTSTRWTALYPIYRTDAAVAKLQKVVRGEIPGPGSGWENLQKVANWQKGAGTAFGNMARSANSVVSAQIEGKDVHFAALALSRFSQAQVIAEDNATGTINLKLDQVPFTKAVSQVAKQSHRKWDKIYSIQPRSAGAMQRLIAKAPVENGPPGEPMVVDLKTRIVTAPPPQQRDPAEQARLLEAVLVTMTPEEREKAEQQIQTMQQMQSLPEGERQAQIQQMAAQAKESSQANLDQRMKKRLRDGTVDQRVAHDREMLNRKSRQP